MLTAASKQAKLAIDFCIVGGGIAGLSTAIALRRVGHRVLVLEKESTGNLERELAGCRMPPNLSKIFYAWGLDDYVHTVGSNSEALKLFLQETGEFIGGHLWSEEVLRETRGNFVFGQLADFRRMLYEVALSSGAQIRLGASVTSIDPIQKTVTLASGEVLHADVIVGADGVAGITRQILIEESDDYSPPSENKLNLYSAFVPAERMLSHPLLEEIYREKTTLYTWFGYGHCVLGYKTGGSEPGFALYAYGPRDGREGNWGEAASSEGLKAVLEPCEERLKLLGRNAQPTSCVAVYEEPPLEDWVTGRLVAVGGAVHPIPPGSIQDYAMAVESGAVLAKIFSHLRTEDQIDSFLYAFQDVRLPRVQSVYTKEFGIISYMAMPPCEFQEYRDQTYRTKRDAGIGVLEATGDMEESPEWVEIKEVFGYDCEDEADNWWQSWGLLRERAKGLNEDTSLLQSIKVAQTLH